MPRIPTIDPGKTSQRARELIRQFEENEGMVTNLVQTFAHSPAVLESLLGASDSMNRSSLDEKLRYRIALTVSELNESPYCLASFAAYSRAAGLSDRDILDARRGESPESRVDAMLTFARAVSLRFRDITDGDLKAIRRAGFGNGEILEIISVVVQTTHVNVVSNIAETEIDFAPVTPLAG
ncbi:carboxymuconolactone decarboxylase family protein [bacterium]|nr:carboxymuconolactone decarboxylase family protein [bacterium]